MAKKKKLQLKPVARGFATTSVPKKPPVAEVPPADQDSSPSVNVTQDLHWETTGTVDTSKPSVDASSQVHGHELDFDSAKADEQTLQAIIDKHQDKTEKEISRALKVIEFERRFSKSLPRLELDPIYRDFVLDLAFEAEISKMPRNTLDEPEDKVLPRLGITYGVLRRLGFSDERVLECLRSINSVELDEAFEWLYLYCPEEELIYEKPPDLRSPRTPRTPSMFYNHSTPSLSMSENPHLELATTSSFRDSSELDPRERDEKRPRVSPISESPSSGNTNTSDDELYDPNLEYAKVKTKIYSLGLAKGQNDSLSRAHELKHLRSRLENLRLHYFFREREAEAHYQSEKALADREALERRLAGENQPETTRFTNSTKSTTSPATGKSQPPGIVVNGKQVEMPTADVFEDNSSDEEGGIFGTLLDTMPESEVTQDGVQVHIRDMPLPKHWAGRTPKALLFEIVQKVDRYAVISYRILPDTRTSRAKRAVVTVRWESAKSGEWSMDEVGCYDEAQAEQYISTVALHSVTFGYSEGFAGGVSGVSGGSGQTYFRLLPSVFRDLWDELEVKRRESDNRRNREVWATLRQIVQPKIGDYQKDAIKANRATASPSNLPAPSIPAHGRSRPEEDVKANFLARRASPAYQQMLVQRNSLPIAQYREEILTTLRGSQVFVLSGETGCGKSTQLPAYILEDHLSQGKHCKIYCTEPRRISAISLAQRVSLELGEPPGSVGSSTSLVGYAIRLESNTTKNTRLAYVTNGIALRMLEGGSGHGGTWSAFDEITVCIAGGHLITNELTALIDKHVIVDEVHERNLDSDFLLIVLKTLIEHRKDLKVILMSATLDAQKISEFFGGCPTLHVPGRTFPVDVRFLEDSIEYTGWSITEGSPYARRFGDRNKVDWNEDSANVEDDDDALTPQEVRLEKRYSPATKATVELLDERLIPYDLIVRLLELLCFEDARSIQYSAAILIFLPGLAEIRRLSEILTEHPLLGITTAFRIFPLHSTISSENQAAVFEVPPPGIRKIVISTNIAETGVTIPDITCVIDSGKHREMRFDEKRQISRLVETLIAKSNAAQRRGRAGRVQAGVCFHLFTRARYDQHMAEHPLPEMLRLSLSDLALRIKILKVKIGTSIEDALSRALDPPSPINVQRAVQALVEVKALTTSQEITPMGRLLSKLPTDVHLGKFLLVATIFGCLDPALTIAATLNSKSPFITPFGLEHEADKAKCSFQSENSDFLTIHNAFSSWRRASANGISIRKFCMQNFLSHQNLQQIEELRQQFLGYLIDSGFIQVPKAYVTELSRARYGRHKTRFISVPAELDRNSNDHNLLNAALITGLYPKVLSMDQGQLRTVSNNQAVSLHPSSVNFGKKPSDFGVNYLCYFTVMQSKKLYAWETGPVDNMALLLLCGDCEIKLSSEALLLDRKIKFRADPKTATALRYLREQFTTILSTKMRGVPLTETQERWYSLALKILGRTPAEDALERTLPK